MNDRRAFLKTSAALSAGLFAFSKLEAMQPSEGVEEKTQAVAGTFELPKLDYAFNALEPYIDAKTMEIHYSKHHQTYVNKLNEAMEKEPSLKKVQLEVMLKGIKTLPEGVRTAVRNHGGGHWNHSFFWKILKTGTTPSPRTLNIIQNSFGSFDLMKEQFEQAATGVFGSGWCWVINTMGTLQIVTTPNQDNPLMDIVEKQGKPLFAIDIWEHAYYLKYQNKRADYVKNFWNVVNWDQVHKNLFV